MMGLRLSHALAVAKRHGIDYGATMLETEQIDEIAKAAATANLGSAKVVSVKSEHDVDWEGEAVIKILIELKPGSVDSISGDDVTKTLVEISDRLQQAGDDRFPMIQYATTDELEELAGGSD
jgi:hypothetical protein